MVYGRFMESSRILKNGLVVYQKLSSDGSAPFITNRLAASSKVFCFRLNNINGYILYFKLECLNKLRPAGILPKKSVHRIDC